MLDQSLALILALNSIPNLAAEIDIIEPNSPPLVIEFDNIESSEFRVVIPSAGYYGLVVSQDGADFTIISAINIAEKYDAPGESNVDQRMLFKGPFEENFQIEKKSRTSTTSRARISLVGPLSEPMVDPYRYETTASKLFAHIQTPDIPVERCSSSSANLNVDQLSTLAVIVECYERISLAWSNAGDSYREGLAKFQIADAYRAAGQLQDAVGAYHRVLNNSSDERLRSYAYRGEGWSLWQMGRTTEAKSPLAAAVEILNSLTLSEPWELDHAHDLVEAQHVFCMQILVEAQFRSAVDCYERVIASAKRLNQNAFFGTLHNSLAGAYQGLGQIDDAISAFHGAQSAMSALADQQGLSAVLNNLGRAYRSVGNYEVAVDHFRESLDLKQALGDIRGQARVRNNLAAAYLSLGNIYRAEENFLAALPLRRMAQDRRGEAITLTNLGRCSGERNRFTNALSYHNSALSIWLDLNDVRGELRSRQYLTSIFLAQGNVSAASTELRQQEHKIHEVDDLDLQAKTIYLQGIIASDTGEFSVATKKFHHALGLYREMKNYSSEALTLSWQSKNYQRSGQLQEAVQAAEEAFVIVKALRPEIANPDFRVSFSLRIRTIVDSYVDALIKIGEIERALDVSVEARAIATRELVLAGPIENLTDADKETYARLRRKLNALIEEKYASRRKVPDKQTSHELGIRIEDALTNIQVFEQQHRLIPVLEQVSFTNMINRVGLDATIVYYHVTDNAVHHWLIDHSGIASIGSIDRHDIGDMINIVTSGISKPDGYRDKEVRAALITLPQLLMPFFDKLRTITKIHVVKDGPLLRLPFHALALNGLDASLSGLRYTPLANRFEFQYTLSLIAPTHNLSSNKSGAITIFSDPVYSRDDPRFNMPATVELRAQPDANFPRLFGTKLERQAIVDVFGTSAVHIFSGFDTNLDNVQIRIENDTEVLHYALHGLYDPEISDAPALALSRYGRDGRSIPFLLHAKDIARFNIMADLVVLSGCDTGNGIRLKGEGLLSLERAFRIAGAKYVVSTHWQVSDLESQKFMYSFYRAYVGGSTVSAALARSYRQVYNRLIDPYYWAGFVLNTL